MAVRWNILKLSCCTHNSPFRFLVFWIRAFNISASIQYYIYWVMKLKIISENIVASDQTTDVKQIKTNNMLFCGQFSGFSVNKLRSSILHDGNFLWSMKIVLFWRRRRKRDELQITPNNTHLDQSNKLKEAWEIKKKRFSQIFWFRFINFICTEWESPKISCCAWET